MGCGRRAQAERVRGRRKGGKGLKESKSPALFQVPAVITHSSYIFRGWCSVDFNLTERSWDAPCKTFTQ